MDSAGEAPTGALLRLPRPVDIVLDTNILVADFSLRGTAFRVTFDGIPEQRDDSKAKVTLTLSGVALRHEIDGDIELE